MARKGYGGKIETKFEICVSLINDFAKKKRKTTTRFHPLCPPHPPPGRAVLNGGKKKCSGTSFPKKARGHSMCSTMVGGGWRLAVGGGWRLAVGSWQLAVGGGWWWLAAVGGW